GSLNACAAGATASPTTSAPPPLRKVLRENSLITRRPSPSSACSPSSPSCSTLRLEGPYDRTQAVAIVTKCLRVALLEEGGDRARGARDDDDGPELEQHVDDAAPAGERVLDLRRDGQQLHACEEDRVADAPDLRPLGMALEEVDGDCPEDFDDHGRGDDEAEAGEQ